MHMLTYTYCMYLCDFYNCVVCDYNRIFTNVLHTTIVEFLRLFCVRL